MVRDLDTLLTARDRARPHGITHNGGLVQCIGATGYSVSGLWDDIEEEAAAREAERKARLYAPAKKTLAMDPSANPARRRRSSDLTPEEVERVRVDYMEGASIKAIDERHGLRRGALQYMAEKRGWTKCAAGARRRAIVRARRTRFSDEEITRAWETHFNVSAVARSLGWHYSSVHKRLIRLGLLDGVEG